MKKLSFLFVAIAFVGLITFSCKPAAAPAATEATEAVEEAAPVVDSAAAVVADTAAAVVEE
jgi:hypothetical protein